MSATEHSVLPIADTEPDCDCPPTVILLRDYRSQRPYAGRVKYYKRPRRTVKLRQYGNRYFIVKAPPRFGRYTGW